VRADAGPEADFPGSLHKEAYSFAHKHFLHKTVHASEAYGPQSVFQAITDLHAGVCLRLLSLRVSIAVAAHCVHRGICCLLIM
jgi:adenosine deaminase